MEHQKPLEGTGILATFGRRKVAPRACVADSKLHLRAFLREALEELGFTTSECDHADDISMAIREQQPDLFVLGLSGGGLAASRMLEALGRLEFSGNILLFGPPASPMVIAMLAIGE